MVKSVQPTFYLLRHGQSLGNACKSVYFHTPDHEVALSELGKEQSIEAGRSIKELLKSNQSVEAYISPYQRAVQTWKLMQSQIVLPGGSKIKETQTSIIREMEWTRFKDWDHYSNVVEEFNQNPLYYRMEGGESMADVVLRAQIFLNDLKFKFLMGQLSNQVVVVSHELFITALLDVSGVRDIDYKNRPHIENAKPLTVKLF